jgi:pyruvate/2-oxoacid:ferredoxin oxidoreductase beta subunit
MIKNCISEEEHLIPGHVACPGCGASLSMRYALKALGKDVILVIPACCWSIIAGPFPYSSIGSPVIHVPFETAGAIASGVRAALDVTKKHADRDVNVVAWGGDGSTFDIGLQALSGAMERNENIIYVCYDNEAYMNTGIQRSSATPWGAWTTTTPAENKKMEVKKNIMEIIAAHRIPYAATCSLAYPQDFIAKFEKAKSIKGAKFIHIYSPCPPGWKLADDLTIRISRMAVKSRIFPLYEVYNGTDYRMTIDEKTATPVRDYIKLQRRFNHLTDEDIEFVQKLMDDNYELLQQKIKQTEAAYN